MTDGEDDGFPAVVVIKGDVGALSELDNPFAKFGRQFLDGATDLRVSGKKLDALPDGCDSALGSFLVFSSEEVVEALDIQQGGVRPS